MTIRPASMDDAVPVLALAKRMAEETATYEDFDFDEEKSLGFIRDHVDNPSMMMVVVEGDNSEIVGAMLATAKYTYFGNDIVTCDDAFYVLPEHRGKGTLAQLLMAYHDWAAGFEPKYIYLGVTLGINDERTINSLKMAGYDTFGQLLRRTG